MRSAKLGEIAGSCRASSTSMSYKINELSSINY